MDLETERRESVAVLTISRPDRANALTDDLLAELAATIVELETDSSMRAVILRGKGGVFSSGFDLGLSTGVAEAVDVRRERITQHSITATGAFWRIWNSPLPFVGAVERLCVGGAAYLASVLDIVVTEPEAEIGMAELRMGMAPPMFNIFPWILGLRDAKAFLLSGDIVSGQDAVDMGLFTSCVPTGEVFDEAMDWAVRLSRMPDGVVAKMKDSVNRRWELAGMPAELERGVKDYVDDKLQMGDFQRRFREAVEVVGVEAAIADLGIELGLRTPYVGQ